jgi:hypothetical protein
MRDVKHSLTAAAPGRPAMTAAETGLVEAMLRSIRHRFCPKVHADGGEITLRCVDGHAQFGLRARGRLARSVGR